MRVCAPQMSAIEEVSLTANQGVNAMRSRRMQWRTREADGTEAVVVQRLAEPVSVDAPVVVLNPLQVCKGVWLRIRARIDVCICL